MRQDHLSHELATIRLRSADGSYSGKFFFARDYRGRYRSVVVAKATNHPR